MNEARPKRVAIYARVSTDDKGQDPENQLRELRAWCDHAGHAIVAEYVEHESGGKSPDYRKRLAAVFEDASRRRFDLLLFWALDRFSREGMAPTVQYLERVSAHGVAFHSYTEPHLDAEDELVRNISLAMLATFAKLERRRISAHQGRPRSCTSTRQEARPPSLARVQTQADRGARRHEVGARDRAGDPGQTHEIRHSSRRSSEG
jgi:DNA invertase Pin-like site-specific DNA recombinase